VRAAEAGRRVLLVSTDPAHSLGDVFEQAIGDRVTRLADNLDGLEIDPEAEADRYIDTVRERVRSLVRSDLAEEADRQIRLARHAPGAVEAALLERVADIILDEDRPQDLVIFDTAPTGHTLRLLSLPESLAAWTDGMLRHHRRAEKLKGALDHLGGPGKGDDLGALEERQDYSDDVRMQRISEILLNRRRKFHQARRVITDAESTAFVLVLTPERLPMAETAKTRKLLEEHGVPIAAVIVNRVLPEEADGHFLEERREREREYLKDIAGITQGLTTKQVPLLTHDVSGLAQLRQIAELLFSR